MTSLERKKERRKKEDYERKEIFDKIKLKKK